MYCHGKLEKTPQIFCPCLYEKYGSSFLKVPIEPSVLRYLIDDGHCEQAPFGRGTETIVDLNTRKCWRIDLGTKATILHLDNFIAPATILEIQDTLAPHLGEIIAQPYQLLIYEEDGMFKPHRDTLRGRNNIGSLE